MKNKKSTTLDSVLEISREAAKENKIKGRKRVINYYTKNTITFFTIIGTIAF